MDQANLCLQIPKTPSGRGQAYQGVLGLAGHAGRLDVDPFDALDPDRHVDLGVDHLVSAFDRTHRARQYAGRHFRSGWPREPDLGDRGEQLDKELGKGVLEAQAVRLLEAVAAVLEKVGRLGDAVHGVDLAGGHAMTCAVSAIAERGGKGEGRGGPGGRDKAAAEVTGPGAERGERAGGHRGRGGGRKGREREEPSGPGRRVGEGGGGKGTRGQGGWGGGREDRHATARQGRGRHSSHSSTDETFFTWQPFVGRSSAWRPSSLQVLMCTSETWCASPHLSTSSL